MDKPDYMKSKRLYITKDTLGDAIYIFMLVQDLPITDVKIVLHV